MSQDIVITSQQARNAQLYQRAKLQAQAQGGRLLIQDAPQRKVPLRWSRDASGINLFGVRRNDVRTVTDYERIKARAARLGARLYLADERGQRDAIAPTQTASEIDAANCR
jgi:hypothetical protein